MSLTLLPLGPATAPFAPTTSTPPSQTTGAGAPSADPGQALFGLLPEALAPLFSGSASGETVFGRLQRPASYQDGRPVVSKRSVRQSRNAPPAPRLLDVAQVIEGADGARKYALRLTDGHLIESVMMPRDVKHPRATLCLSSQVGCAMGCTFCATGRMGLLRQLSTAEIVLQVLTVLAEEARTQNAPALAGHQVTLVFMGMGEPLHNLDAVTAAINILTHPAGLGVSPRRVTVSTSGLAPQIEKLARAAVRPLLAVSINATTDAARRKTMPVTKRYDLEMLLGVLERWPFRPRERILLEYVLLAGENDSEDDAVRLAAMAQRFPALINVIPYNPITESPFARPVDEDARAFVARLFHNGARATIRFSRGDDVAAACGQLAGATASAAPGAM